MKEPVTEQASVHTCATKYCKRICESGGSKEIRIVTNATVNENSTWDTGRILGSKQTKQNLKRRQDWSPQNRGARPTRQEHRLQHSTDSGNGVEHANILTLLK